MNFSKFKMRKLGKWLRKKYIKPTSVKTQATWMAEVGMALMFHQQVVRFVKKLFVFRGFFDA